MIQDDPCIVFYHSAALTVVHLTFFILLRWSW